MESETAHAKVWHKQFRKYILQSPGLTDELTSKLNCANIDEWLLSEDEIISIIKQGLIKIPDSGLADKLYLCQIAKIAEMLGMSKNDSSRIAINSFTMAIKNGWLK